jgi:hypothetical protein
LLVVEELKPFQIGEGKGLLNRKRLRGAKLGWGRQLGALIIRANRAATEDQE